VVGCGGSLLGFYLGDVCDVVSLVMSGVGHGTASGAWIKGAVAVRIRSQLCEKGDEVMETGNFTAGAETPLELFKIRPQSSRNFGSEDIPYRISCDGL
jgi:hypothetical protein